MLRLTKELFKDSPKLGFHLIANIDGAVIIVSLQLLRRPLLPVLTHLGHVEKKPADRRVVGLILV